LVTTGRAGAGISEGLRPPLTETLIVKTEALVLIAGDDPLDPAHFDLIHITSTDILSGIVRRYIADLGYVWWAAVRIHPNGPTTLTVLEHSYVENVVSLMPLPHTVHFAESK
jgi:hypothetical protein